VQALAADYRRLSSEKTKLVLASSVLQVGITCPFCVGKTDYLRNRVASLDIGRLEDVLEMIQNFHVRLAAGFLAMVLALVAVACLSYSTAQNLVTASVWVAHTNEVIAELEATRNSMAEVGFEQPLFENGDFRDHIFNLERLTSDNSRQKARLLQLNLLSGDKLGANDQRSRALSVILEMKSEEQSLLVGRTTHADKISRATLNVIAAFSVIAVLACVFGYWSTASNLRSRERVEKALGESESRLKSLLAKEQELARIDPLTAVPNRRAFYEALDQERMRSRRYRRAFTIAYVDLDNFKKVNDSLGHAVGDELLVQVAAGLKSNLRASDYVGRLGGDEFAVLLPETDATAAQLVLRKLRLRLLEEMKAHDWQVTFSIGAATFLDPPDSLDVIIRMADETMYAIKAHGKDNVSVALVG
jgi:diguanylate cyclase (GGDEF)-like protein